MQLRSGVNKSDLSTRNTLAERRSRCSSGGDRECRCNNCAATSKTHRFRISQAQRQHESNKNAALNARKTRRIPRAPRRAQCNARRANAAASSRAHSSRANCPNRRLRTAPSRSPALAATAFNVCVCARAFVSLVGSTSHHTSISSKTNHSHQHHDAKHRNNVSMSQHRHNRCFAAELCCAKHTTTRYRVARRNNREIENATLSNGPSINVSALLIESTEFADVTASDSDFTATSKPRHVAASVVGGAFVNKPTRKPETTTSHETHLDKRRQTRRVQAPSPTARHSSADRATCRTNSLHCVLRLQTHLDSFKYIIQYDFRRHLHKQNRMKTDHSRSTTTHFFSRFHLFQRNNDTSTYQRLFDDR